MSKHIVFDVETHAFLVENCEENLRLCAHMLQFSGLARPDVEKTVALSEKFRAALTALQKGEKSGEAKEAGKEDGSGASRSAARSGAGTAKSVRGRGVAAGKPARRAR